MNKHIHIQTHTHTHITHHTHTYVDVYTLNLTTPTHRKGARHPVVTGVGASTSVTRELSTVPTCKGEKLKSRLIKREIAQKTWTRMQKLIARSSTHARHMDVQIHTTMCDNAHILKGTMMHK